MIIESAKLAAAAATPNDVSAIELEEKVHELIVQYTARACVAQVALTGISNFDVSSQQAYEMIELAINSIKRNFNLP